GILLSDVTIERDLARTKEELVSVVSHELRTPLATLVGFAELLLSQDFEEVQRRRFLNVMVEEGRRLTALINDFLDLQRMETGSEKVELTPIEVGPLLERALDLAGVDTERPIRMEIAAGLPMVNGDADRIIQVLENLLSNARKYSPHGGVIRLSADKVGEMVEVQVADQGLGLPPEAIPRLF